MLLETERLLIRPFAPNDEETAVGFFSDPDFMVFSLACAFSREGARERFRALLALYRAKGFSKLAVEEKAGGRLIGYCGFGYEPIEGTHRPELGYRLIPEMRGRGLATEAAQAVVADAFARLKMRFVLATVIAENMPSRRVLEKLGLAYRRNVMLNGRELMMYWLDAPK